MNSMSAEPIAGVCTLFGLDVRVVGNALVKSSPELFHVDHFNLLLLKRNILFFFI